MVAPAAPDWDEAEELRLAQLLDAQHGGESLSDYIKRISPRLPAPPHCKPLIDLWERTRHERVFAVVEMPPRHRKLVADSTPVLTPDGWRTHGDLAIGDLVYAPDGMATRITYVSPKGPATLAVRFTDGEIIRVNPDHRWTVYDRQCHEWRVMTTAGMFITGLHCGVKRDGSPRGRFMVETPKAVAGTTQELPVDPYIFGLWLGDGSTGNGRIAGSPADVEHHKHEALARGYQIGATNVHATTGVVTFCILGLRIRAIMGMGKHIPDIYHRADIEQRRELLRGLVDSDGCVDPSGRCRFVNTNRALVDGAARIVSSLGYRVTIESRQPNSHGAIQGRLESWCVSWTPTDGVQPARLPRKDIRHRALERKRSIVSIEPCEPELGHCITVDHPSHCYLVGDRCVPTHNTTTGLEALSWLLKREPTRTNGFATFGDKFAASRSRIARMFAKAGGVIVPRDHNNAHEWGTSYLGGLLAHGYRGEWTGRGITGVALLDDLYKDRADAESDAIRENVWEWFTDVLWTRLEPGSSVIVQFCIAEGEPVLMSDGSWKPIEDIVPGEHVMAYEQNAFRPRLVLAQRASGIDPILTIRARGCETRCNARHPFLTEGGAWVRAGDLKVGDRVVVFDEGVGTEEVSLELAWLFGFLMGDGWVTSWKRRNKGKHGKVYEAQSWCVCVAASIYPELNERAVSAIGRFFGRRPKLTKFGYYRLDDNLAGRQLERMGLVGGAHGKRIPDWVFKLTPECKIAYLRGYAHADGTIERRMADSWKVTSVSRGLIEDTRRLAISAGVRCGRVSSSRQVVQPPHSKEPVDCTIHKLGLNFAKRPDRVVAIESIEVGAPRPVYDLTVDGAENFIAGGFVVHNTRWHTDDLIGRLLQGKFAGYHFERLCLPAICEDENDGSGRKVGEPLWPTRYPVEELHKIQVSIGEYSWASMYQQRPRPKGAEVFLEPGRFTLRDWYPDGHQLLICADPAASEDTRADYSALFVLAKKGIGADMVVWVLYGWRGQVSIPKFARKLYDTSVLFGGWGLVPVVVEAVSGFKAVPQTLKEIEPRLKVRPARMGMPEGGDQAPHRVSATPVSKFLRSQPVAAAWNAGRFLVPMDAYLTWNPMTKRFEDREPLRDPLERPLRPGVAPGVTWADELIHEASMFTGVNDAEDDQVDAIAHGWNDLIGTRQAPRGASRNRNPFG